MTSWMQAFKSDCEVAAAIPQACSDAELMWQSKARMDECRCPRCRSPREIAHTRECQHLRNAHQAQNRRTSGCSGPAR